MVKTEVNSLKPHMEHTRERLLDAIATGRLYQTKLLLEIVEDVNFTNAEGMSPLHRAARIADEKQRTRREMLKLLIRHGADVNLADNDGRHILSWACLNNKEDIVHLLFHYCIHDLDLNMVDLDGNTALMYAVRSQNLSTVNKLVKNIVRFGLDIDLRNDHDYTAYLEARRLGWEKCMEILVEDGHASKDILINPFLGGYDVETGEKGRESEDEKGNPRRQSSPRINRIIINPDMKRKHKISPELIRSLEPTLRRASCRPKSSGYQRKLLGKRHARDIEMIRSYDTWISPVENQNNTLKTETNTTSLDVKDGKVEIVPGKDVETSHSSNAPITQKTLTYTRSYSVASSRKTDKPGSPKRAVPVGVQQRGQGLHAQRSFGFSPRQAFEGQEMVPGRILQRSRTVPRSARSSCSDVSSVSDSSSEMSWHSHFSHEDTPQSFISLSNMQLLLRLYAEQAADTSSFRSGLPMPKAPPPEFHVDEDKQSEGTRSEDTQHTSFSANTKRFAVVTRTVASYLQQKRNLTTIKVKDRIPGL